MSTKDREITFTKDVLDKVTRDMELDRRTVEDVYRSMILYMHHISKNTDNVSIKLPYIGTIYQRLGDLIAKKIYCEDDIHMNRAKRQKIKKFYMEKIVPHKWYRTFAHTSKIMHFKPAFTGRMTFREMEEFQNKYADEKKK